MLLKRSTAGCFNSDSKMFSSNIKAAIQHSYQVFPNHNDDEDDECNYARRSLKQVTHAGTLSALQLPTGLFSSDDHPDGSKWKLGGNTGGCLGLVGVWGRRGDTDLCGGEEQQLPHIWRDTRVFPASLIEPCSANISHSDESLGCQCGEPQGAILTAPGVNFRGWMGPRWVSRERRGRWDAFLGIIGEHMAFTRLPFSLSNWWRWCSCGFQRL